jgi:hypothetical protein
MKTAMQLMLEDLELRYKVLSNAEMLQACGAIEGTIEYAKSLIIKEKEQITKAWDDGDYAYFYSKETGRDFDNGEDYFNEKYKK